MDRYADRRAQIAGQPLAQPMPNIPQLGKPYGFGTALNRPNYYNAFQGFRGQGAPQGGITGTMRGQGQAQGFPSSGQYQPQGGSLGGSSMPPSFGGSAQGAPINSGGGEMSAFGGPLPQYNQNPDPGFTPRMSTGMIGNAASYGMDPNQNMSLARGEYESAAPRTGGGMQRGFLAPPPTQRPVNDFRQADRYNYLQNQSGKRAGSSFDAAEGALNPRQQARMRYLERQGR